MTFPKAMLATLTAMTIAGLWHGANWTYVIFGVLHGLALVVNNVRQKRKSRKLPVGLAWFLTFHFVALTLLIFRSENLAALANVIDGLRGRFGLMLPGVLEGKLSFITHPGVFYGDALGRMGGYFWTPFCLIAALIVVFRFRPSHQIVDDFQPRAWNAVWYGLLFMLCVFKLSEPSEFLYFQF